MMQSVKQGLALGWMGSLLFSFALGAIDHPMLGEEAPTFELRSLDGETVRSEDFRGKHIVLHFGAGW